MRNSLITDIASIWKMEIVDYIHPLADMLTLDKELLPFDFSASLFTLLLKSVEAYRGSHMDLEDMYTEQRNCSDRFFKFHNNNQGLFREDIGFKHKYVREEHYACTGEDMPVSMGEIVESLREGTKDDLTKDVNIPLCILIFISVHMCYVYYGYSKELEEDINGLFYDYDKEMLGFLDVLNGED